MEIRVWGCGLAETVVFSLDDLANVLACARAAGRAAAPGSEGWSRSADDPGAVLACFPGLRLRPGFALRAYLFAKGANANGVVWALPAEAPFPEPEDCPRLADLPSQPPMPPGALAHPLLVVEGDGSPWAYLCASLLGRELAEFGARGRGQEWRLHTLLGADPTIGEPGWRWLKPRPTEWRPWVRVDAGAVTVTFHTVSRLGRATLFRQVDTFTPASYYGELRETAIAVGGAGYLL
ncbi:MAG: hypothetical protein ACYC3S_02820 [Chloroflexota bacterium]